MYVTNNRIRNVSNMMSTEAKIYKSNDRIRRIQ